jgi:hypothetical protein
MNNKFSNNLLKEGIFDKVYYFCRNVPLMNQYLFPKTTPYINTDNP